MPSRELDPAVRTARLRTEYGLLRDGKSQFFPGDPAPALRADRFLAAAFWKRCLKASKAHPLAPPSWVLGRALEASRRWRAASRTQDGVESWYAMNDLRLAPWHPACGARPEWAWLGPFPNRHQAVQARDDRNREQGTAFRMSPRHRRALAAYHAG